MKIIACDIGTSRVKASVIDHEGSFISLVSERIDRTASPDTQSADEWYSILCRLLKQLDTSGAEAIAVTGNMHALLGVDSSLQCVAPAVLWTSNTASSESAFLEAEYGKDILSMFGNPPTPVFTLPKIMHMKKHCPSLYNRTRFFLQSKDFIVCRLTGRAVTDSSDASGTLLAVPSERRWNGEFARELGIDVLKLPPVLRSDEAAGTVTRKSASETGLREGLPVIAGCGDLASAAIGSGVDSETFSLTLGTAGQLLAAGAHGEGEKLRGKLFVFDHADPGRELYLGSVPAGGMSLEWLSKMMNMTMEEFFSEAEKAVLSSETPLCYPYIAGRGAPYMDYRHNGTWKGLSMAHGRSDICLGAICGAIFPLKQCACLMESLQHERAGVVLHSLACRETAVRRAACAVFGQEKLIPLQTEASLLGAAVTVFKALGVYSSFTEAQKCMIRMRNANAPSTPEAEKLYGKWIENLP